MKLPKFHVPLLVVSFASITTAAGAAWCARAFVDGTGKILSRQTPSSADPSQAVPAEMKFIPGGATRIGIDQSALQALGLENPNEIESIAGSYPERKDIVLAPFYMDITEVTNAQWKVYLDATKQKPNENLIKLSWIDGEIPKGQENRPITCLNFAEANRYARWALKRLPTEFEWEFAARGTDGRLYPWGNEFSDPDPEARFAKDGRKFTPAEIEANREKYGSKTRVLGSERANGETTKGKREPLEVGKFPAGVSPFGLHDMAGNVWEWTSSPFTPYDSKNTSVEIKTSLRKMKYGATFNSDDFVVRGGAFNTSDEGMLSMVRQGTPADTEYNTIGLRCARSAKAGVDIVQHAVADLGTFVYRDTAIDFERVWGTEHVTYLDNGLIAGSKHFMLAPSKHVLKDGKLAAMPQVRKTAEGTPLYIGTVTTSTPMQNPPLPPGSYAIALFLKNDQMAKSQKGSVFPTEGWYWAGMAIDHKDAKAAEKQKKKDDKKKGKDDDKPEAGDAAANKEEDAVEEPAFIAQPGSVIVDRTRDHLVLIDPKTTMVAAYPIPDLKDEAPLPALDAKRTLIKADSKTKTPAGEGIEVEYSVTITGKKAINIKFPLTLPVGAFDAPLPPPAMKAENASEAPEEKN